MPNPARVPVSSSDYFFGLKTGMDNPTRPIFALYVIWHPDYADGRDMADQLRQHFGRGLFRFIGEANTVDVLERTESAPDAPSPKPVDWNAAEVTAVVALSDSSLVADSGWRDYIRGISRSAQKRKQSARFFPVITDDFPPDKFPLEEQAIAWHLWRGPVATRKRRLVSLLTNEFCRMLRGRLDSFQSPGNHHESIASDQKRVQVFISHSKHDDDGERVARAIRDWFHEQGTLSSFFDVYDIPPGRRFDEVLINQIGAGAVIAVHTDSYSSRYWCRREVIEAKCRAVPMIVADCVKDADPRGIPYLGNVPIVRVDPGQTNLDDRLGVLESCLLDEVFRTWLWQGRVARYQKKCPNVLFTARPPELITLASLPPAPRDSDRKIVYPEPVLSADEVRLFSTTAPGVNVQTLSAWLEQTR